MNVITQSYELNGAVFLPNIVNIGYLLRNIAYKNFLKSVYWYVDFTCILKLYV